MMIGHGCVAETGCVFISFEQFSWPPIFRRADEPQYRFTSLTPRLKLPAACAAAAADCIRPDTEIVHGFAARQSPTYQPVACRIRPRRAEQIAEWYRPFT